MNVKFISYDSGQILVEYDGGARLYLNVQHVIDAADPAKPPMPAAAGDFSNMPVPRPRVTDFIYKKGDILPPHSHEKPELLHDILVVQGTVIVKKDSGDVTANKGEVVTVKVAETHSIEALTDAVTRHTLVNNDA